jgi:hypothetical protein
MSLSLECECKLSYFPAHKMHWPVRHTVIFLLEILEKNNNEWILILGINWKKTGLLHTKISNHNIIYSSYKPRKSSLPQKSSLRLFLLCVGTGIYKFGNNTYPRRIRCRSNVGHIFRGKKVHLMGQEIRYYVAKRLSLILVLSHFLLCSYLKI